VTVDHNGDNDVGRVIVEVELANYEDVQRSRRGELLDDQVRRTKKAAVVDTGAMRLVVPASLVTELGLPADGEVKVRYADQRIATRPKVRDVWLRLQGREGVFSAAVEPDRRDVLIGAIVLEELDFLVDCMRQTVYPRDPEYIISECG
jgi:predicted aspartyl protease